MSEFTWLEPGPLVDGDLELILTAKVEAVPSRDYVPAYGFEMRRLGTRENMGGITLNVGDSLGLMAYGGHVGYAVEPEYRGQHHAARLPAALPSREEAWNERDHHYMHAR